MVARRGGWIAGAAIVVLAVVVGVVLRRATPPAAPAAPAPGLQGDLVFAVSESEDRSRLWIWNLATGDLRRGPTVGEPVELVNAYEAEPQGGWIGVISEDGDGQVVGLLRNFASSDVPAPVLEGDRAAWSPGGDRVAAASKVAGPCSVLRVETLSFAVGGVKVRFDREICGALTEVGLDGLYPHVGLLDPDGPWVARVSDGVADAWVRDVELFAVTPNGGALVTTVCDEGPEVDSCGGLAYADPAFPGTRFVLPYADPDVGQLMPERFLGWALDGRTGYVLGTFGDVRGVYAVEPIRERSRPPTLVLGSLATEVYVTESFGVDGGELFVSRDGGLLVVRPDGEQVPLQLPEGAPVPDGPIVWVAAAGGA